MHIGEVAIEALIVIAEAGCDVLNIVVEFIDGVGVHGHHVHAIALHSFFHGRFLERISGAHAEVGRYAIFGTYAVNAGSLQVGFDVVGGFHIFVVVVVCHAHRRGIHIFVIETQDGGFSNHGSHTSHKAPRRFEGVANFVVESFFARFVGAIVAVFFGATHLKAGVALVAILHIEVGGGVEGCTKSELVDGLENQTEFEVVAGAGGVEEVFKSKVGNTDFNVVGLVIGDIGIIKAFTIILIAVIHKVADAYAHAPVEHVFDIATKVDRVFIVVTFLLHIKFVVCRSSVAIESLPALIVFVD